MASTKTVYAYSSITGQYLGPDVADESPLEPGVFHIPAYSTELPPPPIPDGYVALFALNRWVLKKESEVPQPSNESVPPPPQAPTREPWQAREQALARLAAYRFIIETGGIEVGGAEIKTDLESQAKIAGALQSMESGFVDSIEWKAANGWLTITLDQLKGIARAVAQHVQACYARERVLAEQVAALPDDLDTLDAFDPAAAWGE